MKVEQCIVEKLDSKWVITSRVKLSCELVEPADGAYARVRLLEAGAGLPAGHEMTVPAVTLSEV